jgi:hypothetical protein
MQAGSLKFAGGYSFPAAKGQRMVAQAMPFAQQHQFLALQVRHGHSFPIRAPVTLGKSDPKRVIGENGHFQAFHRIGKSHQQQIQVAAAKAFEEPRSFFLTKKQF